MLGTPIQRLETTDSTNRVALDWADAPHGACVVARSQSAGRGRQGREWKSPADKGLYLSVILRFAPGDNLALLSLATALAAALALEKLLFLAGENLTIRLKWPNDVLCLTSDGSPRKIGGILCEARDERIVLGVGLNLNYAADQLPQRPIFPASSLKIETGREFEIEAVLQAVLHELDGVLCDSWTDWRHQFSRRCYGIGDVVRVKAENQSQIGIFEGIGDDGALLLRAADGLQRIFAGDVSYL